MRVRCKEGVSLPPLGRSLGGGCTPSPEYSLTSEWKMAHFGAFLMLFLQTAVI